MISAKDVRLAGALGGAALLFFTALTLTLFPAALQFSKYPRAAAQYLDGTLPPERLVDFSPFYFYLHVVQGSLVGVQLVAVLQLFVMATAVALLFLLLRRFVSAPLAAVGAGAFALSRSVVVYTPILEPEAFLLLFLIAFLLFATGRTGRDRVLAGAALAFCVSIRPSVLPLLAVVPLHFFLTRSERSLDAGQGVGGAPDDHDGPASWSRVLRSSAAVLAPSLLVLGLLSLRNAAATGDPSPLGMNAGFVFFEGNNPLSSGRSAVYPPIVGELKQEIVEHPDNPHLTYRLLAARATGGALSTAEANQYWSSKAVAFIADEPARYLRLLGTKARAALQQYRRHDLIPAQRYDDRLTRSRIPAFPLSLLVGMAVLGGVATLRQWRRLTLFYALLGGQIAVMLWMYVSERQRLPMLPALVLFACLGVAYLLRAGKGAKVLGVGAVLAVSLVLTLPTDLTRDDRYLWAAHELADRAREAAVQLRNQGRLIDAKEVVAFSYAAAPWLGDYARPAGVSFAPDGFASAALSAADAAEGSAPARLSRAQLLLAAGRLDEAQSELERLAREGHRFDRGFFQSSEPLYYLARLEAARGQREEAVTLLESALERTPGEPFVLADLGALTGDDRYRQQIARYFGGVDADFLLGMALFHHGLPGAVARLSRTVERLPEFWRVHVYRAAALAAEGDPVGGVASYHAATAGRSDPALLEEPILRAHAAAVASRPSDPELRRRQGVAMAQYGQFEAALEALGTAQSLEYSQETEEMITTVQRLRQSLAGP